MQHFRSIVGYLTGLLADGEALVRSGSALAGRAFPAPGDDGEVLTAVQGAWVSTAPSGGGGPEVSVTQPDTAVPDGDLSVINLGTLSGYVRARVEMVIGMAISNNVGVGADVNGFAVSGRAGAAGVEGTVLAYVDVLKHGNGKCSFMQALLKPGAPVFFNAPSSGAGGISITGDIEVMLTAYKMNTVYLRQVTVTKWPEEA